MKNVKKIYRLGIHLHHTLETLFVAELPLNHSYNRNHQQKKRCQEQQRYTEYVHVLKLLGYIQDISYKKPTTKTHNHEKNLLPFIMQICMDVRKLDTLFSEHAWIVNRFLKTTHSQGVRMIKSVQYLVRWDEGNTSL